MMSDLSSAEYELLHDLLDTTPSLEEELRQHQLTLEQAKTKLAAWQKQAASLLKLASLPIHNKFAACRRLADILDSLSEDQALWLYTLLLSDNGLVFDPCRSERTEEQNLLSYLAVEKKRSHLEKTLRNYQSLHVQFSKLPAASQLLQTAIPKTTTDADALALFQMLLSHFPECASTDKDTLVENLLLLSSLLPRVPELQGIAPLFWYLIATRHLTKLCQSSEFNCRFEKLFTYKAYQIDVDNGKNFNHFLALLSFFEELCTHYAADPAVNMELSLYGFAVTSNICEWYFQSLPLEESSALPKPLRTLIRECRIDCFETGGFLDCSLEELAAFEKDEHHRKKLLLVLDRYCQEHPKQLAAYAENASTLPEENRCLLYTIVDELKGELPWLTPDRFAVICSEIDTFIALQINEKASALLEEMGRQWIEKK